MLERRGRGPKRVRLFLAGRGGSFFFPFLSTALGARDIYLPIGIAKKKYPDPDLSLKSRIYTFYDVVIIYRRYIDASWER